MRKTLFLLFMMLGITIVPVYGQAGSILDIVRDEEDLSTLSAALDLIDESLAEALDEDGPYTLLAPTNVAFANVASALDVPIDDLLQNEAVLTQIVEYHIIPGQISSVALESRVGEVLPTLLSGAFVSINVRDNGVLAFNNVGDVVDGDQIASNGVVHVVDDVLLNRVITETLANPPVLPVGTPEATETEAEPTDEATPESTQEVEDTPEVDVTETPPPEETEVEATATPESTPEPTPVAAPQMVQIRFFHLASDVPAVDVFVNGNVALSDVDFGETSFYVDVTPGDVDLLITANEASIDDALLQQGAFPVSAEGAQTIALIGSLEADTLAFVVLDSAFPPVEAGSVRLIFYNAVTDARAVDIILEETRLARLERYQTTSFEMAYDNFDYALELVPVVAEGSSSPEALSISAEDVTPNATYFIGVVGAVDQPQLMFYVLNASETAAISDPFMAATEADVVTLAASMDNLSLFSQALEVVPGLADRLHGEGPYTILAPTDQAFADLAASTGLTVELLFDDVRLLRDMLNYHIVDEIVPAEELVDYESLGLPTLYQAYRIGVFITDEEDVLLNGRFELLEADLEASNGLLHTIDAVLLPLPIYDALFDSSDN